jgi:hypothetical protein
MKLPPKLQAAFHKWVDTALSRRIPSNTAAFHFNLYEGSDSVHVQLIGTKRFDAYSQDWPEECTFTTGEDIFEFPYSAVTAKWETNLKASMSAIRQYLSSGANATVLKSFEGVGVGYVDGDVHVVWQAAPPNKSLERTRGR